MVYVIGVVCLVGFCIDIFGINYVFEIVIECVVGEVFDL